MRKQIIKTVLDKITFHKEGDVVIATVALADKDIETELFGRDFKDIVLGLLLELGECPTYSDTCHMIKLARVNSLQKAAQ